VPELSFLANMNISPLTVEELRKLGWNIVRIPEVMDRKSKDVDILAYARNHNKVVITQDLDFSMILAIGGYTKPSLINLRLENAKPDFVTLRIIDVISVMERELKQGVVVTIDETSARYRDLPIQSE
jgi:predicted nuclease of predicted toxin-antitoxin system